MRAPDASAQLMQLREPEAIGPVDEDGVGAGHIDAALDDGGAQQEIEAAVIEIHHQPLELALAHLTVAETQTRLRYQGADLGGELLDPLDLIVHEIHLAAAAQ